MRPRNYNNGKLYEIVNLKTNECLYYGYSTANLTDIKKQITFNIDNSKYRNIKKTGVDNIQILLIENVNSNNLDELKTRYLNFILENPLLETEDQQETRPQPNQPPSQQPSQQANHHEEAPSQPTQLQVSQPLEARPQAIYQSPHHLHLPPRQHSRPLPPSRDYTQLIANAFDK